MDIGFSTVIEITNRCNLRCPFCASASGVQREDELSRAELQEVLRQLKQVGCRRVNLLGGEFLLRKDWFEIASDVKATGMELTLITNGLLVDDAAQKQFLELEPQTVGVSLDGATPETYRRQRGVDGFQRCMDLICALQREGIRQVTVITTFTSLNINEFDEFAKLFWDTDTIWQVQMAHKAGSRFDDRLLLTPEQYEYFVERVTHYLYNCHDHLKLVTMDDFGYFSMSPKLRFTHQVFAGCPAGTRVLGIRSNGDVLGCLSLGDEFVEANLRDVPLEEIWTSGKYFTRFREKAKHLTGHCAKCAFAERCKAGCSAQAISATGTLGENLFCVRRLEEKQLLDEFFSS